MPHRHPLHDHIDTQLVIGLLANMKDRENGVLSPKTLAHDMQRLEDEIAFAELRFGTLKESFIPTGGKAPDTAHSQAFGLLLNETEQELMRLYNARQFLQAEKMINDGVPREQVVAILQQGDSQRKIS